MTVTLMNTSHQKKIFSSDIPTIGRLQPSPLYSNSELAVMQMEDPDLGPVTEWLKHAEIPTSDDLRSYSLETRKIWDLVPMVHLLDNVLVFRPQDDADIKLVVPTALCRQLFDACHSDPLAAHLGSFRITQELKNEYFWPGLRRDIEIWCKECPICAKGRGPPPHRHGQLPVSYTHLTLPTNREV